MRETIEIEIPSIAEVSFEIINTPEDAPIDLDEKMTKDIQQQIDNDNYWAWCQVEVVASYRGITASEYLGCCSYKDKEDFKSYGYYCDMMNESYRAVVRRLRNLSK